MAVKKWRPTVAFRRFRAKNTSLSAMYMTAELGREVMRRGLAGKADTARVTDELSASFEYRLLPESVAEFTGQLDERAGVERLHLLMICSANLESYLQEATKLYVASLGYADGSNSLNAVGKAIAFPVVNSSTLPKMIKYLEPLLKIVFGVHRERWVRAYKLRCEAAHEGGVVTGSTLKAIPDLGLTLDTKIVLGWAELKDYLYSAFEIASLVDHRISKGPLRLIEVSWLLAAWKDANALPAKSDLWTRVHRLGTDKVPRKTKEKLEKELY